MVAMFVFQISCQFQAYDFQSLHLSPPIGTKSPAGNFLIVQQQMNWREAQHYCRKHHTDLASVRNQTENNEICQVARCSNVWTGLFKDTWTWSDQSNSSFRYWGDREVNESCAAWNRSTSGQWIDIECLKECPFVCYGSK
uniref:C-type lectin domain-containing protein n=1 Tax=Hucho hucho TaxID=62062 RepID=A0A4W5R885_9TELE